MGAHAVHAAGKTNTGPARAAIEEKFRRLVDPEGTLPPAELAKRVRHAKSLHYSRLSKKAVEARQHQARNSQDDVASGNVWPEEED